MYKPNSCKKYRAVIDIDTIALIGQLPAVKTGQSYYIDHGNIVYPVFNELGDFVSFVSANRIAEFYERTHSEYNEALDKLLED